MENHKKYDSYGFRIKPKKNVSKKVDEYQTTKKSIGIFTLILIFICLLVGLFLMSIAGYISWYCYANDLRYIRIGKTILASIFFYLYIPYFIFLRVVLKSPCL